MSRDPKAVERRSRARAGRGRRVADRIIDGLTELRDALSSSDHPA